MHRTALIFCTAALVVGGCAGGSDASSDTEPSSGTAATTAVTDAPADDAETTEPDGTTPADTTGATEPPSTEVPEPAAPLLVESGAAIELLTAPVEAGTQPELTWGSVDGAERYRVVVLDGDDLPYWSWSGPETSVFLGGGQSSDGAGPSVGVGFTWSVIALDADNAFVASSPVAPLAS